MVIFVDSNPAAEYQTQINQIIQGKHLTLEWNMQKPANISEYPTIIVNGSGGEFRTGRIEEFEKYMRNQSK